MVRVPKDGLINKIPEYALLTTFIVLEGKLGIIRMLDRIQNQA